MQDLGQVTTRAAHVAYDGKVYIVAGLAAPAAFGEPTCFSASIRSFRSMTRLGSENVRPNRVDFYVSGRGLGRRSPSGRRRHLRRYLGGHEQFHTRFGATAGQPDQNCCRWLNVAFRFSGSSSYSARSRLLPSPTST